jgi:hypothetical protein
VSSDFCVRNSGSTRIVITAIAFITGRYQHETDDLRTMTAPTFLHGDDDQIVPIGAPARAAVKDRAEGPAEDLSAAAQRPSERGPAGVLARVSRR